MCKLASKENFFKKNCAIIKWSAEKLEWDIEGYLSRWIRSLGECEIML